jgi:hypothetical protein
MSNYPTLSEMGINNPGDIERYSRSTTNHVDILRIIYKRKKGSLLPTSKRFEFGRSSKTVVADSGTEKTETIYEISPFLHRAVQELDKLIDSKKSNVEHAKLVKDELQRLHQEISSRMSYIESLIDEM